MYPTPESNQLSKPIRKDLGLGFSGLNFSPKVKRSRKERAIPSSDETNEKQRRFIERTFEWLSTISEPLSNLGTSSFSAYLTLTPLLREMGLKFDWDKYTPNSLGEKAAVGNWIFEEYLMPSDVLSMLEDVEPTLGWIREWLESVSQQWRDSMGQYFVNNFLEGIINGLGSSGSPGLILGFKSLEGLVVKPLLAIAEGEAYNAINTHRGPSNYALKRSMRLAYSLAGIQTEALELELEEIAQGTIRGFEWQMNEIALNAKLMGLILGYAVAEVMLEQWKGFIRVAVLAGSSWVSANLPGWVEKFTMSVHQMWKEPISKLRDTSAILETREIFAQESVFTDEEQTYALERNRGTKAAVAHDEFLLNAARTIKIILPSLASYLTGGNMLAPTAVTASTMAEETHRVKEMNSTQYCLGRRKSAIESLRQKLSEALTRARGLLTLSDAKEALLAVNPELNPELVGQYIDESTLAVSEMENPRLTIQRMSIPVAKVSANAESVDEKLVLEFEGSELTLEKGQVVGLFERNASGKTTFLNKVSGRIRGDQNNDVVKFIDGDTSVPIQAVEPKSRRRMMPFLSGSVEDQSLKTMVLSVLLNYSTILTDRLPFDPRSDKGKTILFAWLEESALVKTYAVEIRELEEVLLEYLNSSIGDFWSSKHTDKAIFEKSGFSGAEGAMLQFAIYFAINENVIFMIDEPESKMSLQSFLVFLNLLESSLKRKDFSAIVAANKFTHLVRERSFFADEIMFNQELGTSVDLDKSVRFEAYELIKKEIDRKRIESYGRTVESRDSVHEAKIIDLVDKNFPDAHDFFLQIFGYVSDNDYENIKIDQIEDMIADELLTLMAEDFTSQKFVNKLLFIVDLMLEIEFHPDFQFQSFEIRRIGKILNAIMGKFHDEYLLLFELMRTNHITLPKTTATSLNDLVLSLNRMTLTTGYFSRTVGPNLSRKFTIFNSNEYRSILIPSSTSDSDYPELNISLEQLMHALSTVAETQDEIEFDLEDNIARSKRRAQIFNEVGNGKMGVEVAITELRKIEIEIIQELSQS